MDYLVRLFEKQDYAEQFLSGQLRLLPAGYYIEKEGTGRLDGFEGAVSKSERLNISFPILCCLKCSTQQSKITSALVICTSIIRDFCKCGGYAVAVEKSKFIEMVSPLIKLCSADQQPSYHGDVIYDIDENNLGKHWNGSTGLKDSLLHKRIEYAYQNEYRFVFTNPTHYTFCINDGFEQPWRVNIQDLHESAYAFYIKPVCEIKDDFIELPLCDSQRVSCGAWRCWGRSK